MKRLLYTILFIAIASVQLKGVSAKERVYLTLDKQTYIAGERIWISGFSFKSEDGRVSLSDISSVMYIELIAENRAFFTLKMALKEGRGSASTVIPLNLPTGIYTLVAYTSYMQNEEPLPYYSREIPVFNTITTERLQGVKADTSASEGSADGIRFKSQGPAYANGVQINIPNGGVAKRESITEVELSNLTGKDFLASISVYKTDNLPVALNYSMNDLVKKYSEELHIESNLKYIPEFEGEVIKGKIVPANGTRGGDLSGMNVFLSVPGGDGEIYTSVSNSKGEVSFFTENIFGRRECVLEVIPKDSTEKYTVELADPFLHPVVKLPEQLTLRRDFTKTLEERSFGVQIMRNYGSDTLFESEVPLHNPLLGGKKRIYNLDDYTRFPVMEEVIIEYVTELRYRKSGKSAQILVRWEDSFNSVAYSRDNTLVLIDGIPVFNHNKILEYDPLKVKSLSIFGDRYYIGNLSYTGIASFKTYTGKYQGLTFDKNVRIVDFDGAQLVSGLSGRGFESGLYPDYRNTIYWEPLSKFTKSETKKILIRTPSIPGNYIVVTEGVSYDGTPVYATGIFTIE